MYNKNSVDEKELPSAEGHSGYHRETLIREGSNWPTCSEAQIDQRSTVQVQTTWARKAAEGLPTQPFSILANQRSDADASQPHDAWQPRMVPGLASPVVHGPASHAVPRPINPVAPRPASFSALSYSRPCLHRPAGADIVRSTTTTRTLGTTGVGGLARKLMGPTHDERKHN